MDSITIGWNTQSLQNLTYSVQIQEESSWMDASCGPDSLLTNICTVRGVVALVTGLKQNTVYRFRVNAIYKDVKSDFSTPSDLFRTAGDAGANVCSVLAQLRLTFYSAHLSHECLRFYNVQHFPCMNPATCNWTTTFIYQL